MKSGWNHTTMCIVVAAALVNFASAADSWKDKKPAEWTQKQMEKFLTNSPWTNTVQPSSNLPLSSGSPGGPGGWGGGGAGGGGGRGGGGGGGGAMNGAAPIMTFQIRWLSAPIMREALRVTESAQLNAAIDKYANDYYIIGVQMQIEGGANAGGPRGGGGRPGGMGGGAGPTAQQMEQGRAQFEAMLIQGATLKFAHQLVHPEKAEMAPCKTGMMTLYMFTRSLKLEDADKNYLFEVSQGPSTTRASFSLKGLEEAPEKGL